MRTSILYNIAIEYVSLFYSSPPPPRAVRVKAAKTGTTFQEGRNVV
ncbi:MAG: hypothetical protein LBG79_05860 [Spirochaetaceae bacterium]|nr:hypothetical protein [Spirochaetaceae bacterium]